MKLRPYQEKAVHDIWTALKSDKKRNPCAVLPTGAGKSLIIADLAITTVKWYNRYVLILTHVGELLGQTEDKINIMSEVPTGIYCAGFGRKELDQRVILANVASLANLDQSLYRDWAMVIIDECHRIPHKDEGQYHKVISNIRHINQKARVVGLTATPYRLNGGLICGDSNLLNYICHETKIDSLIRDGYLSKIRAKGGSGNVDFSKLELQSGDFRKSTMAEAMMDVEVCGLAVLEMIELAKDRKSILVFCCNIAHAKQVLEMLRSAQEDRVELITGKTPKNERAQTFEDFKTQRIRWLVNVDVLTTGFDAPCVDCVVLLRATMSPGLFSQMCGRGLRLSPETGKEDAMILDYGENIKRHGPLDDIQPPANKKAGTKKVGEMAKLCPDCQELIHLSLRTCPCCGFEFPASIANHGHTAAEGDILKRTEPDPPEWHDVKSRYFYIHEKFGKPNSIRVDYILSKGLAVSEWVCPLHGGYPLIKAKKWWSDHVGDALGVIDSYEDVESILDDFEKFPGQIRPTMRLEIQKKGEFFYIHDRELGEIQKDSFLDF